MEQKSNGTLREALTFDDVLLKPGLSELLPSDADIRSRITRDIPLNIPIVASAMDTVTEAKMAIAMAQAGGLGVIHRNLEPDEQAAQVRQVKKFESGMVVNPVTIDPGATLADALGLMQDHRIAGLPGVEGGGNGRVGKLVGILTNRDVRFATDPEQPISELMTKERLVTVRESVGQEEAKRLLHQHRIEKLLVVDSQYRCVGLITVKDIEKAVANPHACKDEQGRLRVAAATTVGDKGFERTSRLIAAGVDLVVVDTAHGHSRSVLEAVTRIKRQSNAVQVLAGTDETPGEVFLYQGRSYKTYRGMGSVGAMARGSADRYFQQDIKDTLKLVPEGVEGQVPYKGAVATVLHQLSGGLRAAMGYVGAKNLRELHEKAEFVRVSAAGMRESHVHDVTITRETPNYPSRS